MESKDCQMGVSYQASMRRSCSGPSDDVRVLKSRWRGPEKLVSKVQKSCSKVSLDAR